MVKGRISLLASGTNNTQLKLLASLLWSTQILSKLLTIKNLDNQGFHTNYVQTKKLQESTTILRNLQIGTISNMFTPSQDSIV